MPPVYDAAEILLDAMMAEDFAHWGPLYVRWEAGCWTRWASASTCRDAPPPARPTI